LLRSNVDTSVLTTALFDHLNCSTFKVNITETLPQKNEIYPAFIYSTKLNEHMLIGDFECINIVVNQL